MVSAQGATTLFPQKPQRASNAQGKPLKLYSNYFSIDFDSNDVQGVNKYTVKFEPEIPDNARAHRKEVLKKCRDQIKEKLEFFIDYGLCCFSLKKVAELPQYAAEHDGVNYTVSIEWVQVMEKTDRDHLNFMKIFFNSMLRSLKFETIGQKSFNQANAHNLAAHNIKVWPGFDTRVTLKESGVLLNIDVCFKVIRTDNCLAWMQDLRSKAESRRGDGQAAIQEALAGATVVTRYNQKTYRIDRVDFAQSPSTTFDKQGTPTSYQEYYRTRYNENISDMNQPLLINKDRRTGNEVALIPELCQLTGLTDAMRADFRLMKDLAVIMHTNADAKIKEIKNLMTHFKTNVKCVEKQQLWHMKINDVPQQLGGFKYTAGKLQMGAGASGTPASIDIEANARDLDRKIQGKMFTQPAFKTWGIFHGDRDAQVATQFTSTMKQCLDQCGYPESTPNVVQVRPGARAEAWIKALKAELNEGVQMVVLILPGQKGKCVLYDDVKRFLLTEYPIPSQVILTSTIQRGKNLRSIISKVLIQMNAKVGGTPWAVDNLPYMDQPTMICGMDVFHSTTLGKKSVLALTASMNQSATTYWSTSVIQDEIGQEGSTNLQTSMTSAIEAFKRNNGAVPAKIIFYRDGVGEGQIQGICVPEIEQIKAALASHSAQACKMMYINCSKRVNTRIFAGDPSRFQNPAAGTVIDQCVTDRDTYEFYLVSVAAKQGMTMPTRFSVLYDTIADSPDKIQLLTYKLCYNYYNVSGAIKEPACIRYAHRLAALVGERGGKGKDPPVVHKDFEQGEPKLYFI